MIIKNYVFNHYHQSIIYCIKYQQAYPHIKYDILADFDQISVRTHTRAKSGMFFAGLVMSILKFAPRYYFGLIVFTLLWLAGPSTSKAKVGRYANGQNKRAVELKKYLGLCTFRAKKIFGKKKNSSVAESKFADSISVIAESCFCNVSTFSLYRSTEWWKPQALNF